MVAKAQDRLTAERIREALQRSGYLLESRASQLLEQRNWRVVPNYVYVDPDTGVTRELDLLATFTCNLKDKLGQIHAILIAECVNNPQRMALFERPPGFADADTIALRTAGNLQFILCEGIWKNTLVAARARDWHHCCGKLFASQFCSFSKKNSGPQKGTWMASHDDEQFRCLGALYKSLEHVRQPRVTAIRDGYVGELARLEVYYPALILQGKLINVQASGNEIALVPARRSLYKRGVIEYGTNNVLFIDILKERALSAYCQMIEQELATLGEFLNENADDVRHSLDETQKQIKSYLAKRRASEEAGRDPPDWPPFAH